MPIVKVTIETSVTGTVQSIKPADGKFGPQYAVQLDDDRLMYLDKEDVNDQIVRRLKLKNAYEAVGHRLRFWKKPMRNDPAKGFLNIDWAEPPGVAVASAPAAPKPPTSDLSFLDDDAVDPLPPPPAAGPSAAERRTTRRDQLAEAYLAAFNTACALLAKNPHVVADTNGAGILQKSAATIFIAWQKEGLV